jgi:hypothetical protein
MSHQYKFPKQGESISKEDGGKGSQATFALYRHPDTEKEVIVQYHPLFGNSQANAFEQVGYEFVREAEPSEVTSVELTALDVAANSGDAMKGLNARVAMLEGVAEQNKVLEQQLADIKNERAGLPPTQAELSGEHAISNAVDSINERGQGQAEVVLNEDKTVTPVDESSTDDSSDVEDVLDEEKPLDKQNREELNATATAEGIEDAGNLETYKTKADLVTAIQEKRAENAELDEDESEDEDSEESE